jgi:hypothetical protein
MRKRAAVMTPAAHLCPMGRHSSFVFRSFAACLMLCVCSGLFLVLFPLHSGDPAPSIPKPDPFELSRAHGDVRYFLFNSLTLFTCSLSAVIVSSGDLCRCHLALVCFCISLVFVPVLAASYSTRSSHHLLLAIPFSSFPWHCALLCTLGGVVPAERCRFLFCFLYFLSNSLLTTCFSSFLAHEGGLAMADLILVFF